MEYYSVLFFVSQCRWNTILCYSLFHSADRILFFGILCFTVQIEYYSVIFFVSQCRWNSDMCSSLFHIADGIMFCVILCFTMKMV